jgi:hypothetical protein
MVNGNAVEGAMSETDGGEMHGLVIESAATRLVLRAVLLHLVAVNPADFQLHQAWQLDREQLLIPARSDFLVGQDVGALVGFAQVGDSAHRHRFESQELRGFDTAMAGDDLVIVIN